MLCCSFRKSREIVWFSFLSTLFSHLNRKRLKRTALHSFTYYLSHSRIERCLSDSRRGAEISWRHLHSSLLSRYLSWSSLILPPSIDLAPNLSVNYSALLTPCTTDQVQPKGFGAACSSHATEFSATRSEELQRNKTAKIIFYSFGFCCYQSRQVISSMD